MADSWNDYASSDQYQALDSDQQEAARNQYFLDKVAPHVPTEDLGIAKSQFDDDTRADADITASPIADAVKEGLRSADTIKPSLNLQLSNFSDNGTTGIRGNANVGADFPVNGGYMNVNADVSGEKGKWRDNGESGHFGDFNVDRVSASYNKLKNTYGIDFDPKNPLHNFMLTYKHDL